MQTCAVVCTEQPTSSKVVDDENFPVLTKLEANPGEAKPFSPLPAYHPAKVTEVIEIPNDQRRYQNEDPNAAGKRFDAHKRKCMEIIRETGVEMNMTNSKSNMLTIVLSGHPVKVSQAKRGILAELQQQETVKIHVPHEFHGYLIGRRGDRLRELQAHTMTRISVPPANSTDPDSITVTGSKQGIAEAKRIITETIERQSQQGFERLDIPKIYHPFLLGPNGQLLDNLKQRTLTKINFPPPNIPANIITVSGKREGVLQASEEMRAIYEQVKLYKTIPVRVKRSQHRLVFGPRGSGLADILAQTGVSVELPTDDTSEELILRGRPEDLGRALSMVYERAESSITEEISASNRFHKLLIGKRGSALAELREGYERVHVEFRDNQDKITVEGPPEEVGVIVERLRARIAELEATVAMDTLRVDPKYFRHIIGRQGATILRLREHKVQIRLPTLERGDNLAADQIVIEGNPVGVEKAKAEIRQLVERLENEKCKDMIIEPHVQQLLCTGYKGAPPPIRTIYDGFPKVSFVWPDFHQSDETIGSVNHDNPSKSVVQLRGDRQQVDAAAERLVKLIKQVIEENYRQEIRLFKEFRPHIFGRGSSRLQRLLDDTKTRIQYPNPSDGSDVFTIIGREENVQQAIKQLEDLQKQLANVKEVIVSIPSALTTKFVGDQAPSLRSICEQCSGVHMRFLNPRQKNPRNTNQVEVVMLGPPDELAKAQKLLDQLNSKVAQLCAEELVHVDPKFHGFLIGRQGSNIIRFRERHNVELLFPDRMETDPKLSMEIRIVGTKDGVTAAKADLEALIKTIEDEVEHSVAVDPSILRDILNYRRSFTYPDLERVRVIMPKTIGRSSEENPGVQGESTVIKLIGQKACVEAATQSLQSLISDVKEQVTKEFPLSDPSQFIVLDRARSQFREMERNHRVFINLPRTMPNAQPDTSTSAVFSACLLITGRPEQVDLVFEEDIKPILPVEEEFPLAKEFHRSLITVPTTERERPKRGPPRGRPQSDSLDEVAASEGQSKATELKQKHGVLIRLPPQATDTNSVFLRGTPSQITAAKADLTEWVEQCEALKADRIARSYELTVHVPTRFIQSIIALRQKLTAAHDVAMRFGADLPPVSSVPDGSEQLLVNGSAHPEDPAEDGEIEPSPEQSIPTPDKTPVPDEERLSTVIFRGYQERVAAAKEELEAAIAKLKSQVTEALCIPAEVHSILIGSRGSAIQKVMQEFSVHVEFPNRQARESGDADTVLVSGDQENVDRACDFLIAKANDLIVRLDSENRNTRQKQYREELLPANGTMPKPSDHLRA
ncbi:hypothetical protein CRM22_011100 [Opisthorchis felineus]|uniref:K Homology domain-containing protein n=1 Tax=Opisthorchis felineus TaxID=147828 RepID=A0A4V6RGF5_OPIFE|nr:hypothetical protein CRM22_011100 [Opisthorchis felineus]